MTIPDEVAKNTAGGLPTRVCFGATTSTARAKGDAPSAPTRASLPKATQGTRHRRQEPETTGLAGADLRGRPPSASGPAAHGACRRAQRERSRGLAHPLEELHAQLFALLRRELRQVRARRADSERERLPEGRRSRCSSLSTRRCSVFTSDSSTRPLAARPAPRHSGTAWCLPSSGCPSSSRRAESQKLPQHLHVLAVGPHVHAATTPPGRTTRRISLTPVSASRMKFTTSWDSAASKLSSFHGSSSAAASPTSAPPGSLGGRGHERLGRIRGGNVLRAGPLHQALGERPGPASDVDDRHPGSPHRRTRGTAARALARVAPHEAVVLVTGDSEAHASVRLCAK